MNEENLKIQDILDALKKRWQLIVGITLIATIIATVMSFFIIKPKYQATTKLFIGKEDTATINNSDVQMYQQLIKTYSNVITTSDLVGRALESKNIDLSAEKVLGGLQVVPVANTQILQIKYISTDKNQCQDVVQAITDEFVSYSEKLVGTANSEVVESARMPDNPISPNKKRNIAIAVFIGLILGASLAVLFEFMDTTFKEKESLEHCIGLPVIGVIPNSENIK